MPPGGVTSYWAEHLGTAFLRAVLDRAGISSRQYCPVRGASLRTFAAALESSRPALVGLTAYESNLRACRELVRVARETLPDAVVLVGGPNATFSPEETLALLSPDACVRGAAEGSIATLAQIVLGAPAARRRLPELAGAVRNLALADPAGVRFTPTGDLSSFPGESFRALDDLPSPYQAGLVATGDVGYLTARGCNQHCTYCSFAAISGRRVHYHGVERVLADLAALRPVALQTASARRPVTFYDDAFTLAPERARTICEGIIRRGLQMPFEADTRADRVDVDLLRLMKRAGFERLSFGLESAVPRVLRTIGKVQDPDTDSDPGLEAERGFLKRFRAAVATARETGLSPAVSVIGGLPGESAADFRATLDFVRSLGVAGYAHNILTVLPGTPLHRDRERHGLRVGRQPRSGSWQTQHTYAVRSVPPAPGSSLHLERWEEACLLTDALCGRPRPALADDGSAWAAILHAAEPDPSLAPWLREVLAVNGLLVVVDPYRPRDARARNLWLDALAEAGVPWGHLVLLARAEAPNGEPVLCSLGTAGAHRFRFEPAFRADGSVPTPDAEGQVQVPVWLASGSRTPPPGAGGDALPMPAPQIADGCRWWSGWRRCRRPKVLHVRPDRSVAACWHGPPVGKVGDGYAALAAGGQALGFQGYGEGDGCPMAAPGESDPQGERAAERYDVGAHLFWALAAPGQARSGPREGGHGNERR